MCFLFFKTLKKQNKINNLLNNRLDTIGIDAINKCSELSALKDKVNENNKNIDCFIKNLIEIESNISILSSQITQKELEVELLKRELLSLKRHKTTDSLSTTHLELKNNSDSGVSKHVDKQQACISCDGNGFYIFNGGSKRAECPNCYGTGLRREFIPKQKTFNKKHNGSSCSQESAITNTTYDNCDYSYRDIVEHDSVASYYESSFQKGDLGGEYSEMNHDGDD